MLVLSLVNRLQAWAKRRKTRHTPNNDQRHTRQDRRLQFEELEPRILYSADPLSAAIALVQTDSSATQVRVVSDEVAVPALELVVIDLRVEGALELATTIAEQGQSKYRLLLVDASTDGLAAVTAQVRTEQQWQAIHLVTHGASGQVQLGSSTIDSALLAQRGDELTTWAERLTESGDFLLYGCDVGAGSAGEAFVQQLAARLQADVAASDNTSGNAALGGDWVLEVQTGTVDAPLLSANASFASLSSVLTLTPQGGEELANLATAGTQTTTYVKRTTAMDSAGNFVVVWQDGTGVDGSGIGVYLRRFDASGNALSGDVLVNTYTSDNQYHPQVAMNAAGDFVVVWQSTGQDGGGAGVYAQRFNANGTTNGGEFRVNQTTTLDQSHPAVAIDSAGNFVVVWESNNQDAANTLGIYSRRYAANGTPLSGEVLINSTTAADQHYSAIGMDAAGNYTIAWISQGQDGDQGGIFAQRFNSSGVAQGSEFQVNTTNTFSQDLPAVAMDGSTIVILWESSTQDAGGYGVYGRRFTAAGVALGLEFQLNSITAGTQENVTVAMTGSGGFLAGWNQSAAITGVYVREYDASGVALSAEVQIDTTGTGFQGNATVATNATGSAVVSWAGEGPGDGDGMFFRRYTYAGNAAPVLNNAQTPVLGSVSEDSNAPVGAVGSLVSSLVDFASPIGQVDNVTDADGGALLGIAVTAANSINGTWWYTINGGSNWLALGSVSESNARLLNADANTRVYYQPVGDTNGVINNALMFRAWDRTTGVNGGTAVLATTTLDSFQTVSYAMNNGTTNWNGDWVETDVEAGGASAGKIHITGQSLSITTNTVGDNIYRNVNLSGSTGARLSLSYSHMVIGGDLVRLQVSSDGGASYNNVWAFSSLNNGSGTLSLDISAYASANTRIRFYIENDDNQEEFLFDNVAISWNSQTGGTTAFSVATDGVNQTVVAVNDAPTLTNTALSLSVQEDAGLPVGAVGSLLSTFVGGISDPDASASRGVAIVASNETNGTWYYTLDSGSTWLTVGTVSNLGSLLLAENAATRLYFAPTSNFNGLSSAALTIRAWDQTSGVAGTKVDTSVRGGTTAFSSALDTVDVTVNPVNDPPVLSFGEGSKQFTENGAAIIVDGLATLSDPDSPSYAAAELIVDFSGATYASDLLSVRNQGTGIGQVGLSGATVSYSGTNIGTVSGTATYLRIVFNASATEAAVQAVMRNVTFIAQGEDPNTTTRTVRFQVIDSAAAASTQITKTITMNADNDVWVTSTTAVSDGNTSDIWSLMANRGADGVISFAEAISATNGTLNGGTPDLIKFNIAAALVGGAHTINVAPGGLPSILEAVIIDGTTDADFAGTPIIELNGTGAGVGANGLNLTLSSSGSTIRGLVINRFNGNGIFISSDNNTIVGNYIGTNVAGTAAMANGSRGIHVAGASNTIGDAGALNRNVISGNTQHGILVGGAAAAFNIIQNNFIGTNAAGNAVLGNVGNGIAVYSGANNTVVGGAHANTIGGNLNGVVIYDNSTTNNQVTNNFIGVDSTLLVDLGNIQEGVELAVSSTNSLIGGNSIAFNGGTTYPGVSVEETSTGNAILANSIWNNGRLGIDLNWAASTPLPNDVDDLDGGANFGQNTPVMYTAVITGSDLRIIGHLESAANTTYRIEFFRSPLGTEDPTGYGEGRFYLGSREITTDASGRSNFDITLNSVTVNATDRISSTATYRPSVGIYRDTSEFSQNVPATAVPAGITVTPIGSMVTSETGTTRSISVVLNTAPSADVSIALSVSDASEGSLNTTLLTFTSANWNIAQTVTVTGVDDSWIDGDVAYNVITAAASSLDLAYNGLNANDVSVTNTDTDTFNTLYVTTASDVADGDTSSISSLMANMGADTQISLREAILATNATNNGLGGSDRIYFNIAGTGLHTIDVLSALPTITRGLIIDGSTQNGFAVGAPVIELNGASAGAGVAGLQISATGSVVVSNLVINRFSAEGIVITNSPFAQVLGSFIGTDATGTIAMANGDDGIVVSNSDHVQIGDGTAAGRNVIAGNGANGIGIYGVSSFANYVNGNYIGVDVTGSVALGNVQSGVAIDDASNNLIQNNTISGNLQSGIYIINSADNIVLSNLIGRDQSNTIALGNSGSGIYLDSGANNNQIGDLVSPANIIASNSEHGIHVEPGAQGNAFLRNSYFSNSYMAIDLNGDGVSNNDATFDSDTGANGLQNFPVLYSSASFGGDTYVSGELNSAALSNYRIEFYESNDVDGTGHGEAQRFLGYALVSTDAAGRVTFNSTLAGISVTPGNHVTALAILDIGVQQYRDTSEFSANLVTTASLPSIIVSPISASTSEAGAVSSFTVVLTTAPTADVTISLSLSDPTEISLGTNLLTFTAANWNVAQFVAVTGVDDSLDDGDVSSMVVTAAAVSADLAYNGRNASDVSVNNIDNDTFNTIVVTTANDIADGDTSSLSALVSNMGADGFISLREAILAANATANGVGGNDRINFSIAGAGLHTISVLSALPDLLDSVTIDGSTQSGYAPNAPVIEIDGSAAGALASGLVVNGSGGNVIHALVINRFERHGIWIAAGGNNTITGNIIGLNAAGDTAMPNQLDGISVETNNNVIGGLTAGLRNVVSGNSRDGVRILSANDNQIYGNYIGTDVTGSYAIGNLQHGVGVFDGSNNQIGNGLANGRNIISGNGLNGVILYNSGSGNNIAGNYIGVDESGALDVGNGFHGVSVFGSISNFIEQNIISGNQVAGVYLGNTSGNAIRGNKIGVDVTGTVGIGNIDAGISIDANADNNTIGDTVGGGNTIAFNFSHGVAIDSASVGNSLLGNTIFGNAGLAIDLNRDNVINANDAAPDSDTGANGLQNHPVITSAASFGGNTTISVELYSAASATYRIEFYEVVSVDASGHGEAFRFLGFGSVSTTPTGYASLTALLGSVTVTPGSYVTALATRDLGGGVYDGTSEFAANVITTASLPAISVSPISGNTSESGTTATFTVVLATAPTADVTIALSLSDTSEASLSSASLTFTSVNWNIAQTVTVTGMDDTFDDGDIGFSVLTAPAVSSDLAYSGRNANDVSVINVDDDTFNTVVVTTTNDVSDGDTSSISALMANMGADGRISLREAILATNATANGVGGNDTIHFNIADPLVGGVHSIQPTSALPGINDGLNIVGSSEPDFVPLMTPVVEISGAALGVGIDGLAFTANSDGSVVSGLVINRFVGGSGIYIADSADNISLSGNFIGVLADGITAASNLHGISIFGSDTTVGGTTAIASNVISGNSGNGIYIAGAISNSNIIFGNKIGTSASGLVDVGNGLNGVLIASGSNTLVGSDITGAGNLISGNGGAGIRVSSTSAVSTSIEGNYIGTDITGNLAIGNADGIAINGASDVVIGRPGVSASGNLISGNAQNGILVYGGASNVAIFGNRIGTNAAGNAALGNLSDGIYVGSTGTPVVVGSADVADRNIISGNQNAGVLFDGGSGHLLQGNYIGTDATGTIAIGNLNSGIFVGPLASNVSIGGALAGQGNLVSGNLNTGIQLLGNGASIAGNRIGLTANGTALLENQWNGIEVLGGTNNSIGLAVSGGGNQIVGQGETGVKVVAGSGTSIVNNTFGLDAAGNTAIGQWDNAIWVQADGTQIGIAGAFGRNVIAGSLTTGILLDSTNGTVVQNNILGLNTAGTSDIASGSYGIWLQNGSSGNLIGGTGGGQSNTIANHGIGVWLDSTAGIGNGILHNSIYQNTSLGIDLGSPGFGVTPNDVGDVDTGPNTLQNYPVLTRAEENGVTLDVSGSITGVAGDTYRIEFYGSPAAHVSGYGEGRIYLGFINVTPDAGGNAVFVANLSSGQLPLGYVVSATASHIAGNTDTSEFSLCVTVVPPNIAPVANAPTPNISVNENTWIGIAPDLVVSDADSTMLSGARVRVTANYDMGVDEFSWGVVAGITAVWDNTTGTITFTGTESVATYQAMLRNISYIPASQNPGSATKTIEFVVYDDFGVVSNSANVFVTPIEINNAPVLVIPAGQTVTEDTPLVIVSGFNVSDADANLLEVTMNVSSGNITLASLAGLTFSNGDGISDANLRFTGDAASINAALNGLSYLGLPDTNFLDAISIQVSDLGATGTGGILVANGSVVLNPTPVNDSPIVTIPAVLQTNEDIPLVFSGGNAITVQDVDVGATPMRVVLTVSSGQLTLSSLSGLSFVVGDGLSDITMEFTGLISDINTALNGLVFTPTLDYVGGVSFDVQVSDQGGTGLGGPLVAAVNRTITVVAVNDAPVNSVPGAQAVNEDTLLLIGGISVSDVDGNISSTQLTVTNGTINVNLAGGATIGAGANGSNTLTLTGSQAQINAALATLSYQGNLNFNGADTLTVLSTDGSAATDSDVINITVNAINDAPVNSAPGAQAINEDTALSIGGITINDVDGNLTSTQLTVTNGTINVNLAGGATIGAGANGSNTLTLSGSQAQINAALATLSYQANLNFNGSDALTVLSTDGSAATDSDAINITVNAINDAPVNAVPGAQTVNEDTPLSIGGVTINDVDGNISSTQLTVTNGTINVNLAGGATIGAGANGSNTLTLSGSQAQINAALATLSYQGNLNVNGSDALTVLSTDGSAATDSDVINITVDAINDVPVNSVPGAQSVNEDTPLPIGGVSVSDVDGNISSTQLTVTNGTINVNLAGGATIGAGANGSNTLTLTGSQAQINAALATLSYQGNLNFNGSDALTVLSTDAGAATDSDVISITVDAVNDAPVNATPGAQAVNEDTTLSIVGVSVSDVDGNISSTQLTVTNGTINVNLAGGAIIGAGANGSNTLTLSGSQAQINAALATLSYQGNLNFNGSDALIILSTDGSAATDNDVINITVNAGNDAPVNAVPAAQAINEDTALSIGGVSVSDVDGNISTTQLTVTNGTVNVNLAGGAIIGAGANGSNTLTLSGSQAQINAALATLSYQGNLNFNGSDALTVLSTDGGAATDSDVINITVNAINDAPVNAVPGAQAVNEDTSLSIASISINDVDGNISSTQLTVTNGTINVNLADGATIGAGANGSNTLTLSGSQAQINAALATLSYQANLNFNGSDALTVLSTDGSAATDSDIINMTVNAVNDAPQITLPGPQTVNEDNNLVLSGPTRIQVADVDAGGLPIRVSLSVASGLVTLQTLTGLTFLTGDGVGDATMVFEGSLSDINVALDGLQYTPASNYAGPDSLSVSVDDLGNSGAPSALVANASLAITVQAINDAPIITVPGSQNIAEEGNVIFAGASQISVQDVDSGVSPIRVSLTVTSGSLSLSSLTGLVMVSGSGTNDAAMVFEGSLTNVNAALNNLLFTSAQHFNGAVTLNVNANDLGSNGLGGALLDSRQVTINVSAVNDAPQIAAPVSVNVNEDGSFVFVGANLITVADVDIGGGSATVTLSVTNGTLTLSSLVGLGFSQGDGVSDSVMQFTGSPNELNAALSGLIYRPSANYNGPDSLAISFNDLGNTGAGGPLLANAAIAITVNGLNDAPFLQVPTAQTVQEDALLILSGSSAIVVNDLDVGAGAMRVSLSVTSGSLSLSGLAGLSFTAGDGIADTNLQFTGDIASLNAALNGLSYLPNAHFNGVDNLQILLEDLGGSGVGGNLTVSNTVQFNVLAVNDAIVAAAPTAVQLPEDTIAFVRDGSGNSFRLSDVDAIGVPIQVTLTASAGVLSISLPSSVTLLNGTANGSSTLTLSGEIQDVNFALSQLQVVPPADFFGPLSITLHADDMGGQAGSGPNAVADIVLTTQISAVNDAPVVRIGSSNFTVTQTGIGNAITGPVSIVDVDNGYLQGALVSLGAGYVAGSDQLFVDSTQLDSATMAAITTTWDATQGQMRMQGSATQSQYAAMLSAMRFSTSSANYGVREILIEVNDGNLSSNAASANGDVRVSVTVQPPGSTSNPVDAVGGGGGATPNRPDAPIAPAKDIGPSLDSQASRSADGASADDSDDSSDRRRRSARATSGVTDRLYGRDDTRVKFANRTQLTNVGEGLSVSLAALSLSSDDLGSAVEAEERQNGRDTVTRNGVERSANRLTAQQETQLVEDLARSSVANKPKLEFDINAASATTAGAAAFATLLLWSLRAGGLVAAIASSAPAWRNLDPMPLLLNEADEEEHDSWGNTQDSTAIQSPTQMEVDAILARV